MYRIIISVLIIGLLTGCSIGEKKLRIFKLEEPRANLNLEVPTMPQLEKLRWIIITSDNADEVFQKMEEQGLDPVLFGLSDKDFQLIAKNFAQIRAHLKVTNDLLEQYKEYYEPEKKEKVDWAFSDDVGKITPKPKRQGTGRNVGRTVGEGPLRLGYKEVSIPMKPPEGGWDAWLKKI